MESINTKIAAIIGLNVLIVLILVLNQYFTHPSDFGNLPAGYERGDVFAEGYKSSSSSSVSSISDHLELPVYSFDDPVAAVELLESLDRDQEIEIGDIPGTGHYTGFAGGYDYNNKYCKQHRVYFVDHPEIVFKKVNFITNYWKTHKIRTQVIPAIGYDIQPELTAGMKELHNQYKYDFKLQGTIFFMHNVFFMKRQVGRQYSCLSQESNHIPGHDGMARKDRLGEALVEYAQKYSSRPQCFNFDKNFPKTWVMQKKDQCLEFFKDFNSPQYKELKKERKVVYFRKIGANVHEGKGVFPVNDEEEQNVRDMYKNGKLCGTNQDNNLMQLNIHDLLLLENRKFGVRMYLFIASVNPVIAYYHDGYYRLSVHQYDPNSMTKGTFVTNIGVNLVHGVDKKTEEEIQEDTCWFNEDFAEYLQKTGQVTDPNWLQNELRPEYKKVMIHLVRMAQKGFFKISSVFELFGIDFVMGSDLKLWFIEANATPLINGFSKDSTKLINKMMLDVFEIVVGLLRSRMKRVVLYINEISKDLPRNEDIPNLGDKRRVFRELIKNRFEPEYLPSAENGFELIIDENLEGVDRYAGLIDEECL